MKIQTILSIAAVGLLAVGCKDSTPAHESTAASDGEVRGTAIAKLEKTDPEPIKPVVDPIPTPVSEVKPETAEPQVSIEEVARQAALETAKPVLSVAQGVTDAADEGIKNVVAEVKSASAAPVVAKSTENPAPAVAEKNDKNPAPATPKKIDGEYLEVGFDKLAGFEYEVPEEEFDPDKKPDPKDQPDQIPADVKSFNKKLVALKGFMMPLKVEDGLITEMLIMRDQSACCYGTVPKINEWVSVKMMGKGVKPIMDQTITVFGRLKVGEMRENGYLIGIYEMDGEKIIGPLEF